jgi:branched-chain amino acid transport system substrate-binding protein
VKSVTKEATSAVNKLITTDKVVAILGLMTSSEAHAVLPILNQSRVVAISPSATDSKLSIGGDYFFRTIVSDTYEGLVMAEFAFNKMKYRSVALLYVESAGPFGVSETFQKEFIRLGGKVPVVEKGLQNSTDFRSQLTRIKANKVDAIFVAGLAVETGTILKQARELGIQKQILAHEPAEDPEVRKIAGKAADGVIFATSKLDPATGDEPTKKFYEKFRAKYGEDPRSYAANAYDSVHLLAKAIEKYGTSPDGITKGLYESKDYGGASGKITFDQNGDVLLPLRIMTIENGEIKPLGK